MVWFHSYVVCRGNKTKSLIGPIGSFQNSSIQCNNRFNQFNQFKLVFLSKSEEYQIENPKLQNMMQ